MPGLCLVKGGRDHGSFGKKSVNYPERTVAIRPEPVRAEQGEGRGALRAAKFSG